MKLADAFNLAYFWFYIAEHQTNERGFLFSLQSLLKYRIQNTTSSEGRGEKSLPTLPKHTHTFPDKICMSNLPFTPSWQSSFQFLTFLEQQTVLKYKKDKYSNFFFFKLQKLLVSNAAVY